MQASEFEEIKLFIDTMVFLHYRPLHELNLTNLLNCQSVTVVVPRVTVKELDEKKDSHSDRKVKDRARRALYAIYKAITTGSKLEGDIGIEQYFVHPEAKLVELRLNPSSSDDILVAAAVTYQIENPNCKVVVLTEDVGPRLTCFEHGISTAEKLDDSLKLASTLDATERELRDAKKELQRQSNAQPKIELLFNDSPAPSDRKRVVYSSNSPLSEEQKEEVRQDVRKNRPPLKLPNSRYTHGILAADYFSSDEIPIGKVRQYNRELKQYYARVDTFFNRVNQHNDRMSRIICIDLSIHNTGTAPAEDVDITLIFPSDITLFTSDTLPKPPELPAPPEIPQSASASLIANFNQLNISPPWEPATVSSQPVLNVDLVAGRPKLTTHLTRVKHGKPENLPEFYVEIDCFETSKSFHCDYELILANLTMPVTGKLHFIIEEGSPPEKV